MDKTLQKQDTGDDFWADVYKGVLSFIIGAGIIAIVALVSIWIGVYIAGLK